MYKFKLFCIPYAGGSANIYTNWRKYLDSSIELIPLELAGRGKRISEPLYMDMKNIVEDLFPFLKDSIDDKPYAFFGHSLGAIICYELAKTIVINKLRQPIHIFFSGRGAPHIHRPGKKKYYLMEDEEFKREILSLGGTPGDVFEHPELVKIFLPLLKNDFRIADYTCQEYEIKVLEVNLTILSGIENDLTSEECIGWNRYTSGKCEIEYFDGNHFFLHNNEEAIVRLVENTILRGVN